MRAITSNQCPFKVTDWLGWCARFSQHNVGIFIRENSENQEMLSTIQKAFILKSVDLFKETPTEILADVANLLTEVEILAGENLFRAGETGDSMYIVVSGKLRAHDGEHFLNYLEPRAVFGEMALLLPAPRIASITAEEDSTLFRLDALPFHELMNSRSEIAQGIIRVLTLFLRDRVHDVFDLRTQLAEWES